MVNTSPLSARTEFAAAVNQIANERGIDPEVILDSIKAAILAAFRKDNQEFFDVLPEDGDEILEVKLDPQTGAASIINNETKQDITPPGFGRIAAQTAKQVILQRVREAEKDAIIAEYKDRVQTLLNAMVLRFDGRNVIVDIGRGQGIMPPEEQITNEYYKMNQRLAVYIKDIRETIRGRSIIVSRSTPELVEALFAREVPEVSAGAVEIKAIAREAGHRTKLAVFSSQEGVDPVGSCVGQKGVRVQEVINELNGEKIDIIQYNESPSLFIAAALAPAEGLHIVVDEEKQKATVTVPDDQLSLAIGKGGQNVRLAAKLTGYKIDIKGESGEEFSVAADELNVDDIPLSRRVKSALDKAEITSLTDLKAKIADEEPIEGIGPKSLEEIHQVLAELDRPKEAEDQSVGTNETTE